MRKIYSLLLLCLMGTVVAWAEDTYESVYTHALADWTSDDITAWSGSNAVEVSTTYGLGANANLTATYVSKSFIIGEKYKVKYEVDWTFATATGRTGNYNWIQFGSFLRLGINSSYNMQLSTDAGATWNATTLGYYSNGTYTKHIEVIFNTKKGVVEKLSFDGTDYTSLASGKFSTATFNTVSTGFIRGGSVSWTLANYITNIAVSQAAPSEEDTEVAYTVNFKYNNTIISSIDDTAEAGDTIKVDSPVTIDDVKYYAIDGDTLSMTLSEDETKNVLNVNLRLADTQTVNINAVDADGNLLEVFSGTRVEGDAASNIYYTRVVLSGDEYYTVPAANGSGDNYAISMAYGSEDAEVVYTLNKNIEYYAEESGLNISGSFRDQQQVPNRASGGDWNHLAANSYLYTDALLGGEYTIDVSGRNHGGSTATLDVQVLDENGYLIKTAGTMSWEKAVNAVQTVTKIMVPEGGAIAIAETAGYTSNIDIDYLIAYRTGDLAEDITVNSTGVSSYVTTFALDFSGVEGLTAMIATDETEDEIVMTKVTKVPAGTPIIVRGTPGETYTVPGGDCTELPDGLENRLSGSTTETFDVASVDNPVYALKNTDGDFHRVASTVTIPTGIAYLVSEYTNGALGAKRLTVFGEEEDAPTAVSSVVTNVEAQPVMFFNAAGQQVGEDSKGLVIGNDGKKMIK